MGDSNMRSQLLQAIQVLYDPARQKDERAAVDRWLNNWQTEDGAWSLADELLHDSSMPQPVHFLCAQTLRTKVERDFDDLPESAPASLRDSLMELLLKFGEGVPSVRTQICLALSALAAHLPAQHWGTHGAVRWFAERLGSAAEGVAVPCMLELLTVLPQEAQETKAAVHPDRRRQFRMEMEASVSDALHVLASCLSLTGDRLKEHLLCAFGAWMRLSGGRSFDGAVLATNPLTQASIEGLRHLETFDAAVESLSELVWCTAWDGMPEERMLPLVHTLVPEIMSLRPRFAVCARRAAGDDTPGVTGYDDDEDTARGMARLFAEVGEAYVGLIAQGSDAVMEPVQALLEVAGYPDDDICSNSFLFWHKLASQLVEQRAAPTPAFADILPRFTPVFEQLVRLIQHRVKYPLDYEDLTDKEKREWKESRYKIAETLEDAASVLLGERSIKLLVEPLRELSLAVAQGQAFDWRTAEATLYCVRSVFLYGQHAPVDQLVELFAALPQLPKVPKLQYTVALTCQAYADWITSPAAASTSPGLVTSIFQLMSEGMTVAESSFAAAHAFFHLCDAMAKSAGGHPALPDLVPKVMQTVAAAHPSGVMARLRSPSQPPLPLSEVDVAQVLKAAAVLARALPEAQTAEVAKALLEPPVSTLTAVVVGAQSIAVGSPEYQMIRVCTDRCSTIVRFSPPSFTDAIIQLYNGMWGSITRALDLTGDDMDAAESVCRLLRYSIKAIGVKIEPLVPPLCNLLPSMFAVQRNSCYLYVASEVIKVFGPHTGSAQILTPLFHALLQEALRALPDHNAFTERPDIVDDLFLLLNRVLSYCPPLLANSDVLHAAVSAALSGAHVQHMDALASIATFIHSSASPCAIRKCNAADWQSFVSLSKSVYAQPSVGPRAARVLLAAVLGIAPRKLVEDVLEALISVVWLLGEEGVDNVARALQDVPERAISQADKQRFVTAMQRASQMEHAADESTVDYVLRALYPEMLVLPQLSRRTPKITVGVVSAIMSPLR